LFVSAPVSLCAFAFQALGFERRKEITMSEPQFTIGVSARCSDGECGVVIRVVIDPVARKLTHIVIEPKHRQGLGRLVPLDLVASSNDEVMLRCSMDEFERLEVAEETEFLPGTADEGYDGKFGLPLLYLSLGPGSTTLPITYDKLPVGEVAVSRGVGVHATDGEIGKVQGLVIDPTDHCVTHVLLQEGHLWGREEVAIPISAVVGFEPEMQLSITKQEVRDLPAVDIGHPDE
jgi:sporulation protein YlmC with PRC-barrel domain